MDQRRLHKRRVHSLYSFIENNGLCVYCGAKATCQDHFTPLSFVSNNLDFDVDKSKLWLLPACKNCNGIAGTSVFKTVAAKRRYIQDRLKIKFRELLTAPTWSEKELSDMSDSMQIFIRRNAAEKEELLRRIRFRNKDMKGKRCANCNKPVTNTRDWKRFCNVKCQQSWHHKERSRIIKQYRLKHDPAYNPRDTAEYTYGVSLDNL